MAQIDMTKMSSKGQVVIPQELREDFNEGDKLVVIRNNDQIILKKASEPPHSKLLPTGKSVC